jgi:hypothetical protein
VSQRAFIPSKKALPIGKGMQDLLGEWLLVGGICLECVYTHVNVICTINGFDEDVSIRHGGTMCMHGTMWGQLCMALLGLKLDIIARYSGYEEVYVLLTIGEIHTALHLVLTGLGLDGMQLLKRVDCILKHDTFKGMIRKLLPSQHLLLVQPG